MAILAVVDKKWPAEHVRRYVSPVRESGITCSACWRRTERTQQESDMAFYSALVNAACY